MPVRQTGPQVPRTPMNRAEPSRTVFWQEEPRPTAAAPSGALMMIDQRRLPHELAHLRLTTAAAVAEAIRDMAVRGAPAIGVSAAFGLALAAGALTAAGPRELLAELGPPSDLLRAARPTAVNLGWAVDSLMARAAHWLWDQPAVTSPPVLRAGLAAALLAEAQRLADDDVAACERMGLLGADLLPGEARVIHHCNTGGLAAVAGGTALGVIHAAHRAGKRVHVLVDETRPRLQGARLTCWELGRWGVPHQLIVDGAAAHYMARGDVDAVLIGADRIAANGDVANKIGSYGLAVSARHHGIPFYVVAPTSTVDLRAASGADIPIEERPGEELTVIEGRVIAPAGTRAANPAFDVTPAALVNAIVTEAGLVRPPYGPGLAEACARAAAPSPSPA